MKSEEASKIRGTKYAAMSPADRQAARAKTNAAQNAKYAALSSAERKIANARKYKNSSVRAKAYQKARYAALSPAERKAAFAKRHENDPGLKARVNAVRNAKRAAMAPEERKARDAASYRNRPKSAVKRTRSPEQRKRDTRSMTRAAQRRWAWVGAMKAVPCVDCGKKFPSYVMDFDHRPGTEKSHPVMSCVSMLATRARKKRVLEEIEKCDVVCSNCHRERTDRRASHLWPLRKTTVLARELKSVPCADCGKSYPHCAMDFDHRPGTNKVQTVGVLAASASKSRMLAEIEKCDIVCSNCHRERTHRRKL